MSRALEARGAVLFLLAPEAFAAVVHQEFLLWGNFPLCKGPNGCDFRGHAQLPRPQLMQQIWRIVLATRSEGTIHCGVYNQSKNINVSACKTHICVCVKSLCRCPSPSLRP